MSCCAKLECKQSLKLQLLSLFNKNGVLNINYRLFPLVTPCHSSLCKLSKEYFWPKHTYWHKVHHKLPKYTQWGFQHKHVDNERPNNFDRSHVAIRGLILNDHNLFPTEIEKLILIIINKFFVIQNPYTKKQLF